MNEINPAQFARVRELFDQACDLDVQGRAELLERECSGDVDLQAEVESLLCSHDAECSRELTDRDTPQLAGGEETQTPENRFSPARHRTRSTMLTNVSRAIGTQGQSALWIILALLVLSAFVTWAYVNMRASLRAIREDELRLLLASSVAAIENHIELEKAKVRVWTEKLAFRRAIRSLLEIQDETAKNAAISQIRDSVIGEKATPTNFYLFSESQRVIAASAGYEETVGRRVTAEGAALVTRVIDGETVLLMPSLRETAVHGHEVEFDQPLMAITLPIFDPEDDGKILGAMLVRGIELESRFFDLLKSVRSGESGETYAFDKHGTMLSESRFDQQLRELGLIDANPSSHSSLTVQIRDPGGDLTTGFRPTTPLGARALTKMAAFATAGEDGLDLDGYHDYRGVNVVGAWKWLPQYNFGVTTEIDYSETYAPMQHLNLAFGAISTLLLASIGVIGHSSLSMARLRRRARNVKQVGQYSLGRLLGEGGMGQVYAAQHALLKRPTAVKLLRPEQINDEMMARFEREVQLASQLSHPNTIEIYDYGQTSEGIFFYAMEYLRGITLSKLIEREGPIPHARVVHILGSACRSLREAHGQGFVHRDIKPQNIMLCLRGGESDVVKVLDFGLVKPMASHEATKITKTMGVIGTPLYMAPERLRNPESNDPASDIYSLGAVGFNLLTGRDIFHDVSDVDVYYHVINTVPKRVSEFVTNVPAKLDQVIADCLAKEANARPASVSAVLNILDSLPGKWADADAEDWWQKSMAVSQVK